ncbi:putative quinol monooxygenase [Tautonia sp. JC769]|uniref:putative quinol monooxygenase n=1 Tax=Tautonia TaxID=2680020 RepID=UPI001260401C|nr:putative quinol monooxygenase [Tautonia marina]
MIHVIATITTHPGRRADLLTEFAKILEPVRAEDGCIEYGTAVDAKTDIAAQIPFRPDVVTVVEKWESLDHLKAHLDAPHMHTFRDRVKNIVTETSLSILESA